VNRVVVALGGNALLRRGEEDTFGNMYRSARLAAERVADIAGAGWEVVVTHGNGPQVGRILLQQEAARQFVHPMPLDVCGALSQGQIGYLLQVTIGDVFYERGMERPVTTILTLTRVPADDPAFQDPTKPIGPFYERDQAERLAAERGWVLRPDPHGGFRRVVPSPTPYSIVEAPVIRGLVAEGVIVIASGGGGVPVIEDGPRLVGGGGRGGQGLGRGHLGPRRRGDHAVDPDRRPEGPGRRGGSSKAAGPGRRSATWIRPWRSCRAAPGPRSCPPEASGGALAAPRVHEQRSDHEQERHADGPGQADQDQDERPLEQTPGGEHAGNLSGVDALARQEDLGAHPGDADALVVGGGLREVDDAFEPAVRPPVVHQHDHAPVAVADPQERAERQPPVRHGRRGPHLR
jgi:hypothetical protein